MRDKFQANIDIIRLYDEKNTPPEVIKVGIVPFILGEAQTGTASPLIKILVMKPAASGGHLVASSFQLAKGTRHIHVSDNWCDMREDDLRYADPSFFEPLIRTALREGSEEVGLKHSNIKKIFDMGGFTFVSATRNTKRPLHMFAAEIVDKDAFDAYERSTAEVRWMTQAEFHELGRADHVKILDEILDRLRAAFASGA